MDIDSALDDISGIRDQLASSTRFQGFAPKFVAITGCLALALTVYQHVYAKPEAGASIQVIEWVLLAIISTLLIGTEAVVRARRHHKRMADLMINRTLRLFLPAGLGGAVLYAVIFMRQPELIWLLPGLSQLLIGVGVFAALSALPRAVSWAAAWYFIAGAVVLFLSASNGEFSPFLMGVPFFVGQMLMAIILYRAAKE